MGLGNTSSSAISAPTSHVKVVICRGTIVILLSGNIVASAGVDAIAIRRESTSAQVERFIVRALSFEGW